MEPPWNLDKLRLQILQRTAIHVHMYTLHPPWSHTTPLPYTEGMGGVQHIAGHCRYVTNNKVKFHNLFICFYVAMYVNSLMNMTEPLIAAFSVQSILGK